MDNISVFMDTDTSGNKIPFIDKLTADEEKELSISILAGEKAKKELSLNTGLSDVKRQALLKTAENGDEAFDKLVLSNLPRAIKTAADTYKKNKFGLNEFEDYKQTAIMVICRCARTYDWKFGYRFGTYVHRSLIHEMIRENAKNGYAVRIPEEYLSEVSRLNEMAEAEDSAKTTRESAFSDILSAACRVPKSLQSPVSKEDEDTELGEMIPDPAALTAEEIEARIDQEEKIRMARTAFAMLSEDERSLLNGRLELGGEKIPMRAFVGISAKSISGVQKKQLAAEKHLREIYFSLPMAF